MTLDSPIVGAGAAIIDGTRLLLIKRGREPGKGLWAVPGGKVEPGEALRDTVRREVKEETGLDIEVGELIWAGENIGEHGHLVLIDYLAEVIGGDLSPGDDADEAAWVEIGEAGDWPLTMSMHDLIETLKERI
jgi:8-oxo-dGTP diphosphatase